MMFPLLPAIIQAPVKDPWPQIRKVLGEIRNALSTLNGNAAKKELDSTGWLKLTFRLVKSNWRRKTC